jgi:hypothetical protein
LMADRALSGANRSSAASWITSPAECILGLLVVGGLLDFPHKLVEALGEWLQGVVLFPQASPD